MNMLLTMVLCAALLLPAAAAGGPLYGTVRMAPGSDRGPEGITIEVTCPGFAQPVRSAPTDARGSFSLLVPYSGRCKMLARRDGRAGAEFDVFVSQNPVRFDLEIDAALNPKER